MGDNGLAREELGETVLRHGLEQAVLVAEQPVDGGRLQARGDRHGARRDRVTALARQQLGGGLDHPLPGLTLRGCGLGRGGGLAATPS